MYFLGQLPKKLKSDKNKDCVLENKPTIHVKLFPTKTSQQSSVVVNTKKKNQLGLPAFP
jgi:hypothetical protein